MDKVPGELGDKWTVERNRMATGGWDEFQARWMICGPWSRTSWSPVNGTSPIEVGQLRSILSLMHSESLRMARGGT